MIPGFLARPLALVGIGFAAGVIWLALIGVPLILPSYVDIRSELAQARADLQAHKGAVDESEGNRRIEGEQCDEAVQGEREYWLDRLADIRARDARFDSAIGEDTGNDQTPAHVPENRRCDDRRIVSARELHEPPGGESPGDRPGGDGPSGVSGDGGETDDPG